MSFEELHEKTKRIVEMVDTPKKGIPELRSECLWCAKWKDGECKPCREREGDVGVDECQK